VVPLHPVVVALLRPHKAAQAAERLRAGDQWAGTNNLVFMTELGRPADPRNLLRVVAAAAKDGPRGGMAGGRRSYQDGGRPARAQQHLDIR
jgi:hypothetical protein